ncbi:hypothetical protein NBRC116583_20270 [Arenicella sp. 4NH20-0111]|uniref:G8 domain-containing protein n=1 Tax=Arenicella sp. 4NH20-0111 TaxID=3127648 RepID=UPI00310603DD
MMKMYVAQVLRRQLLCLLALLCSSSFVVATFSESALAQHRHGSDSKAKRTAAVSIISPLMLLLDDPDNIGDSVCELMASVARGDYDFGETPQAIDSIASKVAEHNAIFDFVDYESATHVAVRDGAWNSVSTWYKRRVPGDCANVVIPEGVSVTYDRELEQRFNTVRVDGKLQFATDQSSKMIVDTLVVDPRGELQLGSRGQPVNEAVTVQLVIANNGDIDTLKDPMLLSRGIVAHGKTRIHGAAKLSHTKVSQNPIRGASSLVLSESPVGWKVGDTIVVAGTTYLGWKWDNTIRAVRYFGSQDEVRIITSINGTVIGLDRNLEYDHSSPRADLKTSVANHSRNVVIRTENGSTVPTHQRGHVMFMHSNNVDVRYAEFHQLGRTDKSIRSFDVPDVTSVMANSNVRGRYSLHLHRIGTSDQRSPAVIVGNAVFGSPGWGYTHHDSHAIFDSNVSFDTFGAGFVAETGNETGVWSNNLAIKGEGNRAINPKNGNQREEFDIGRNGVGFWFQGRMVRSIDNVAASFNNAYAYLHRGAGMLNFPAENFMLPEALGFDPSTTPDDPPIRNFDNNEAFASTVGMYVVKANPNQGHNIYTVISNFKGWNVRHGIGMEYTSHYLVDNADLIASPAVPFSSPNWGIELGTNTSDMVIRRANIEGFPVGMHLSKHYTNADDLGRDQYVIIEPSFTGVADLYEENDASDTFINENELQLGRFSLNLNQTNGRFEYLEAGGGVNVQYVGTKTDSIGTAPVPAGTDDVGVQYRQMLANLLENGYQVDAATGDYYTIIENYFSDRATGTIHKYGFKTYLGPNVKSAINNRFTPFYPSIRAQNINLGSRSPSANPDLAHTVVENDVKITLTANDSDPDGDDLKIDGIVQPRNGLVFLDDHDTVTYRPLPSFVGTDSFEYWVTDSHGNFSKGLVSVTVGGSL